MPKYDIPFAINCGPLTKEERIQLIDKLYALKIYWHGGKQYTSHSVEINWPCASFPYLYIGPVDNLCGYFRDPHGQNVSKETFLELFCPTIILGENRVKKSLF